jgi:hypothetical protein
LEIAEVRADLQSMAKECGAAATAIDPFAWHPMQATGGAHAAVASAVVRDRWCDSMSAASSAVVTGTTEEGSAGAQVPSIQALVDSPGLPSRGSALHEWGVCKPCAFVFQGGCKNAKDCQFCHLCEPGERKRRKKERLALRREETVVQQQDLVSIWNGQCFVQG